MPKELTPTDNADPRLAGFSQPRKYSEVEDKAEADDDVEIPADTDDKSPEPDDAPEDRDPIDVDADTILMRADYNRKMHEVGEARRVIAKENAELAELREMRDFLKENPDVTQEIIEKHSARAGQAEGAPAPKNERVLLERITRLEEKISRDEDSHYAQRLEAEATRVAAEFGFDEATTKKVVGQTIKGGLIGYGQNPDLIYDRLSMAAAREALPKAKANGQRELLDQVKNRKRAATSVTERGPGAVPDPEPDVTKMSKQEYQSYLIKNAEKVVRASAT